MKLNQKGLAISTILYGVLIMASIIMLLILGAMSFRRKTSTDFSDIIESELNIAEYGNDYNLSCPNN